jgi:hypothetical protein
MFGVTHPLVITGSGSGDKTANWVAAFLLIAVAALGSLVWSGLDRKRDAYPSLDRWFHLFMRFAVATTMLSYGMAKIFPLQMTYPSLTRLLTPFGYFSPMSMLWYSVGGSPGYERFAGSMELAAAVLLFVPRLSIVGAMVCFADAVQIFTLNMTYDVPVKLFSFQLILMSLFLLAPEIPRLTRALIARVPGGRLLVAAQVVLAVYYVGSAAYGANRAWQSAAGLRSKPDLYGVWTVDRMFVDGVERAPLVTDYGRWRRVVIQTATSLYFWRMDDTYFGYPATFDAAAKTITLTKFSDKTWSARFAVQHPDASHLTLNGSMDGHAIELRTTRTDPDRLVFVTRGFNWIQEYPFQR